MTKLLEWLSLATIIGVVWAGAYTEMLLPQYRGELLWSPVVLVILFAVFSVLTIIYRCVICVILKLKIFHSEFVNCRVATFNDCEDASKELQRQIGDAREDLRRKGFNFEDKSEKKTD
mgnify:CR=1 FL=1